MFVAGVVFWLLRPPASPAGGGESDSRRPRHTASRGFDNFALLESALMNKEEALSQRRWFIVDAQGKVLGRMATEIAKVLRGKHKPIFTPNQDAGDFVIVINARTIKLTGTKLEKKIYYRHTENPAAIPQKTTAPH